MRLGVVFILLPIVEKLILMFLHGYWAIEFCHAFSLVIGKDTFAAVFTVFGSIVGILLAGVVVRHLFMVYKYLRVWLD